MEDICDTDRKFYILYRLAPYLFDDLRDDFSYLKLM